MTDKLEKFRVGDLGKVLFYKHVFVFLCRVGGKCVVKCYLEPWILFFKWVKVLKQNLRS